MYSPGCGIPGVGCYETKMKSILPCAGSQTAERSPRHRLQSHRGTQTPSALSLALHHLHTRAAGHALLTLGSAPTHIPAPELSHLMALRSLLAASRSPAPQALTRTAWMHSRALHIASVDVPICDLCGRSPSLPVSYSPRCQLGNSPL